MGAFLSSRNDGGVLLITLDDPAGSVNTVSPGFMDEMTAAVQAAATDPSVRGLVVTSAKDSFMAGADLKYLLAQRVSAAEAFALSQRAQRMHRLIETCGKPSAAVLNGFALGGGYELALACTRRIVVDDPRATVGVPELHVGLLPASGATQRLPRMIGTAKALDILLSGQALGPQAALAAGLVDQVVKAGDAMAAAKAWLESDPDPVRPWDRRGFVIPESSGLLSQTTAAAFQTLTAKLLAQYGDNYPAPISILTSVFEGVQVPIDKGLLIESRHFAALLAGSTSRNIIRTTFINKGLAEKGARRPVGVPKAKIAKAAVLGAGMMGAGIAYAAAKAGIDVILLDSSLEAAKRGKAYSEKLVAKQIERGALAQADADTLLGRIRPTVDYADLADVGLVVEAVFEDAKVKADVFAKAEAVIPQTAIFASNTSTLPISELAQNFSRPSDFIGLHFFSPVDRMELVEVITGRETSEETLAHALDFVAQLRKVPIVVRDRRGFYTSRVFRAFIDEGMELLRDGVSPALIENAARQAGMPVGPLAVTDEVTLTLAKATVEQAEAQDETYRRGTAMEVVEKMLAAGRNGRKTGAGFYDYADPGGKRLWGGLSELFPPSPDQPAADEVKRRILYVQALETARCLEEKVLGHPADGDLGSVYGWGFPTWTGGTLSLIDTVGVQSFVSECDRMAQRYGPRFTPPRSLRKMAAAGTDFHAA